MKKAVFAGTFDPVTVGHEYVIEKASEIFDELIVAVGVNSQKTPLFKLEDRLKMLDTVCKKYSNVKVLSYNNLTVDLMKSLDVKYAVRGVRNEKDYLYEEVINDNNIKLYPEYTTVLIKCDKNLSQISSTEVRNRLKNNESLNGFISKEVEKIIKELN